MASWAGKLSVCWREKSPLLHQAMLFQFLVKRHAANTQRLRSPGATEVVVRQGTLNQVALGGLRAWPSSGVLMTIGVAPPAGALAWRKRRRESCLRGMVQRLLMGRAASSFS